MKLIKSLLISLASTLTCYSLTDEELFQAGMQSLENGKLEQASSQFKKALAESNSPRIKLELALVEEQLGNTLEAERLYREVLAVNPPANVRANIEKRLEYVTLAKKRGIERKTIKTETGEEKKITVIKPKRWSAEASIGFFYDDNVNAGPETDSVLIFDLPFVLSSDAQAQEDFGYQINGSAQYSYSLDSKWSLISRLAYARTGYFENDRFDHDSLRFSVTPNWRNKDIQVSAPLQYSVNWLGGDLYTQSVSLSPTVNKQWNKNWMTTTSLYGSLNKNDQVSTRDGESLVLNQSVRWTSDDKKYFIQPRLFYGREFTESDVLSSEQVGLSLGAYGANLYEGLSLYIEPSIRYTEYGAPDPMIGEVRTGTQFGLNINVTRTLPWWDLDLALGYTYTKNLSNADLYDYDRNQVSLVLRRAF